MRKAYFSACAGDPAPLRCTVARRVRFEEVDALGIVWHGRYASYFEDARVALGEKYGIGYMDLYNNGILAPIKKFHVDHHAPLSFGDEFFVTGILHWSEAARINFEFIIRDDKEGRVARGYTVQMMLDADRNICMVPPPYFRAFCDRWKLGELS